MYVLGPVGLLVPPVILVIITPIILSVVLGL
jgi:hypothetical protein